MRFVNARYLVFTLLLFLIEVFIALFVHDAVIRPYVGDYLVVILIYCAVKSVINADPLKVAIGVLLFSYGVEIFQYLHLVDRLGWRNNKMARIIIGVGFEWLDLLAYTLGFVTILLLEKRNKRGSGQSV